MTEVNDSAILWTHAIFDDGSYFPGAVVHVNREDALADAEESWRVQFKHIHLGKEVPLPYLNWSIVATDLDLTLAEPWPGITVLLFPVRLSGGLLLSPEDTRRLLPVVEGACGWDDAPWGQELIDRLKEVQR